MSSGLPANTDLTDDHCDDILVPCAEHLTAGVVSRPGSAGMRRQASQAVFLTRSKLAEEGRWGLREKSRDRASRDSKDMTDSHSKPPRLISVRTLRLENFTPGETPPYAILSHTWDGEEVLFAELESGSAWEKSQYDKIRNTAKQARQDGHDYVWIDCSCINKHNAVELSEAINSMYAWYRNAEVCYALLSDVTRSDDKVWDEAHTSLIDCRYFSRGWTLQEMLASRRVKFFAQDWTPLGLLSDISALVSRASGVPQKVLTGDTTVSECSIAQRLSWAASRTTTKVEDTAYCLLGILEVSLDLRYGEGDQAFARLQEAVLKKSSDLSVLAWTDADPAKAIRLLAHSPVNFRHCHNVVHYPTVEASSEHWTTDRGLKGTFPVRVVQPGRSDIGPEVLKLSLGCYHDSSPEGIIALTAVASGTTPSNNVLSVYLGLSSNDPDFATANNRLCWIEFLRYPENNQLNSTVLWQGERPVLNRSPVIERGDVKVHQVSIEQHFKPPMMWQRPVPSPNGPSASRSVYKSSLPEVASTLTKMGADPQPQGDISTRSSILGSQQATTKITDRPLGRIDPYKIGEWQDTWSKSQVVATSDISRRSDRAPGSLETAHESENKWMAPAKVGQHYGDARRNFSEHQYSAPQTRPSSAQKQAARDDLVDTPPTSGFDIGNLVIAQLDRGRKVPFEISASRYDSTRMQWTHQGVGDRMPPSLKAHWFSESTLSRPFSGRNRRFAKMSSRTGRSWGGNGISDQSSSDSSYGSSILSGRDDEKSRKPRELHQSPRQEGQLPIMSRHGQTVRCPDCSGGWYNRNELSWHRASAHAADNSAPKARLLQRSLSPSKTAQRGKEHDPAEMTRPQSNPNSIAGSPQAHLVPGASCDEDLEDLYESIERSANNEGAALPLPASNAPLFELGDRVRALPRNSNERARFTIAARRFDDVRAQWLYQGRAESLPLNPQSFWFTEASLRKRERWAMLNISSVPVAAKTPEDWAQAARADAVALRAWFNSTETRSDG
ncbi:hypothetical protein LTR17_018691 [Elasticomyces elasticus]|nr:hypothetical protein LTR17_018691 [Elasticomyces elasticus]